MFFKVQSFFVLVAIFFSSTFYGVEIKISVPYIGCFGLSQEKGQDILTQIKKNLKLRKEYNRRAKIFYSFLSKKKGDKAFLKKFRSKRYQLSSDFKNMPKTISKNISPRKAYELVELLLEAFDAAKLSQSRFVKLQEKYNSFVAFEEKEE